MTKTKQPTTLKLEESWAYKITLLADVIARRMSSSVQAVSSLNLSQWRVLAAVADAPGRTASQVVSITPMDKGIVSRAVSTLVDKGILERKASQHDGRLSHLYLTQSGTEIYAGILTQIDQNGASGRAMLSPLDQEKLMHELNKLIENYSAP